MCDENFKNIGEEKIEVPYYQRKKRSSIFSKKKKKFHIFKFRNLGKITPFLVIICRKFGKEQSLKTSGTISKHIQNRLQVANQCIC